MKNAFSGVIILLLIVSISCSRDAGKKEFKPSFTTFTTTSEGTPVKKEKSEIFYGTLNPVEVCSIFNRLGAHYDNSIPNPISNGDNYLSSSKAALNTGIYGVDFGYLKLFGAGQDLMNYVITIRELSHKLGIPDEYLSSAVKIMQGNIAENDSLLSYMNTAFMKMENNLRESGRESTAGLLVIGGWVEAMYITTQLVYDPANPDPEVVQKIAGQKFALNTLLSFIKNYYDDPVVVYYSKKLKYLNNYFDSFNIYFKKGDLEIDTVKQVLRASGTEMDVTVGTLNEIRDYVYKLRMEMVGV
ncbi:MAG TPA: hypothetical protein VHO68_07545 [Bacteroidales bacterium]|nr:hypothetical protein [Bacteroidales bacterium]